ncbi:MAG: T9SS type A sorting domain-containing protein [Bacteroidota bacterium]
MKPRGIALLALVLACMCSISAMAQPSSFDAQFVVMLNDGVNFDVKVQIKGNGSSFAIGTSNLIFSFDATALSNPTLLTAHNFSGGNYQPMNLGGAGNSRSVNIELNTTPGGTVATTYTDVATIRFTTTNPAGASNLQWNSGATVVFLDDETNTVPAGTLNNLNTSPLPIQLASFSAAVVSANSVKLTWSTLSETENYGFEVQRSSEKTSGFASLAGSFIPGHGTTIEPQSYTYTDATAGSGSYYYRLKQIDRDGTVHYSEPVATSGTTDVKERAPIVFALMQNYPNPFNPTTEIKFSVENTGRATLRLYNILGAEVATLFDGMAEAGQYYKVRVDGSRLASGVYFFRLESFAKSDLKKMVLLK